jgi:hypothetical protein
MGTTVELPKGAIPLLFLNNQMVFISSPLKKWPLDQDMPVYFGSQPVGGKKGRYLYTRLASVFSHAPGNWQLVPDVVVPKEEAVKAKVPAKTPVKPPEKKDYYEDIEYKALSRAQLDSAPYDARSRDADGDKICQEGTIWERPCGTRIVSFTGEEMPHGIRPNMPHPRNRIVDQNGATVNYVRGSQGQPRRLLTLADLSEMGDTPSSPKPTRAEVRRQRGISTPSRLSRFMIEQRNQIAKDYTKVSGMTMEKATALLSSILDNLSPEQIESGRGWYWEAHNLVKSMAEKTGTQFDVAVGVVAALSTKMRWDMGSDSDDPTRPNLDFARSLIELWNANKSIDITAEMIEEFELEDIKPGQYEPQSDELSSKNLAKLLKPNMMEDVEKAVMVNPITAAINILRTGDPDSYLKGAKVRSFHDNIAFPDQSDAVTIDSLATQLMALREAAELLKKGGGVRAEKRKAGVSKKWQTKIKDRFGNEVGPVTIYPAFVEIVHRVTERWNEAHPEGPRLTPNDVQAILWYVQRDQLDLGMPILTAHFKVTRASSALKKSLSRLKTAQEQGKAGPSKALIAEQKRTLRSAITGVNKLKAEL